MNRGERPEVQLVLDYTDDVAEREVLQKTLVTTLAA